MSTGFAILLVCALYVAAGAIVLLARGHIGLARPFTAAAVLAFASLGIYHTGGFEAVDPAWVQERKLGSSGIAGGRCEQLVQVLRDSRIVSDLPSREDAVAVSAEAWGQLAPQAREIASRCLAEQKGIQRDSLEIVETGNGAK